MKLEMFFQTRVGDGGGGGGGDGGDGGDGRIFPEHPSPILHAPRDIISRKGKSFTLIYDKKTLSRPLAFFYLFGRAIFEHFLIDVCVCDFEGILVWDPDGTCW